VPTNSGVAACAQPQASVSAPASRVVLLIMSGFR
jgi:hypothetical protein